MSNDQLIIKPKRAKGYDGYKIFSVRIKDEIVSQIDDIAAQTGRSRNELISTFLEFAIQRCQIIE